MTRHFDAIIIGTGQAGPNLARGLAGAGMQVAIIERGRFGGTCVNTGCIPTKTMVASAYAAHLARRAADFGVDVPGGVAVDMARVKARKDAVSASSRDGLESSVNNRKTRLCFSATRASSTFRRPGERQEIDEFRSRWARNAKVAWSMIPSPRKRGGPQLARRKPAAERSSAALLKPYAAAPAIPTLPIIKCTGIRLIISANRPLRRKDCTNRPDFSTGCM